MKKYFFLIVFSFCSKIIFCQVPTLLFTVEHGIQNYKETIAVPFVMYLNGSYLKVPVCEVGSENSSAIQECDNARETLLPILSPGKSLFIINNGQVVRGIRIMDYTQYGFSDWQTYSAKLPYNPNVSLLTNMPPTGFKPVPFIKTYPDLIKRRSEDGRIYADKLIGRFDIDGDNIPEFIFRSDDYEGHFFQIFSFKYNYWQKVFEGGYQGV